MLLSLQKILADPQELGLLSGKNLVNTVSLVKSRISFLCELSNLHLHINIVRPLYFLPKH